MPEKWDIVIEPKRSLFSVSFKEIWKYRDLLSSLVKRDIVTVYKQTVLGPIWFLVQPIMTTVVFLFVFGGLAGLSTDGLPRPLFYLSGIIIWNYFAECFNQTSDTFGENQDMFGKVYFPRLIVPLSKVVSGLIKFGIQFALFFVIYIYFIVFEDFPIVINQNILLFALFILLMAFYGLGFGLVFSALTTKYRDLKFLLQFIVQLLMYVTIIVPFSAATGWRREVMFYNPLLHMVEGCRNIFLGKGYLELDSILYSLVVGVVILFLGILVFNKTERTFIDTV